MTAYAVRRSGQPIYFPMNEYRGDDRDYQDRVQRAQVRADDAIVMATGGSREVQLFAVADGRSIMGKAKLGRRSGEPATFDCRTTIPGVGSSAKPNDRGSHVVY